MRKCQKCAFTNCKLFLRRFWPVGYADIHKCEHFKPMNKFKLSILEHILYERRKIYLLYKVLQKLELALKPNGASVNVVSTS